MKKCQGVNGKIQIDFLQANKHLNSHKVMCSSFFKLYQVPRVHLVVDETFHTFSEFLKCLIGKKSVSKSNLGTFGNYVTHLWGVQASIFFHIQQEEGGWRGICNRGKRVKKFRKKRYAISECPL